MAKKSKKKGTEENVFENPEEATIEGSAAHLAVLDGNKVELEAEAPENTEETKAVLNELIEIKNAINDNYWRASVLLVRVTESKLYKTWDFSTFDDFCTTIMGFDNRKGYYLVQVQHYFSKELKTIMGGDTEDYRMIVEMAKDIGWTKAMKLATHQIITIENAKEVMEKAKKLTVKELDAACKTAFEQLDKEAQQEIIDTNEVKTVSVQFQLTQAQAQDVKEVVEKARLMLKEGAKKSGALVLICQDFNASNMVTGDDRPAAIQALLSKYESMLGLSLVAIDREGKKILYGESTLRGLIEEEAKGELNGAGSDDHVDAPAQAAALS